MFGYDMHVNGYPFLAASAEGLRGGAVHGLTQKAPAGNAPQHDQTGEVPPVPNNSPTASLQDGFPTTIPCFLFNCSPYSIQHNMRR